ncbi:GNAT family N-acetyltransferase [Lactococcus lactis]
MEQVKAWVDVDTELFDDNLGKTYARVISNHEQLVGFGNIDDKGYIDLFYVSVDYQRQGVGQKLLNDLEKVRIILALWLIHLLLLSPSLKNGL